MLAPARVTLKLHRFEIAAATIAALAVGVWALVVDYRLDALNVPAGCIDNWLARADGPDGATACAGAMRAWGEILTRDGEIFIGQGILPLSVMGVLPFAVGLLGGVPIVARELRRARRRPHGRSTAPGCAGSCGRWRRSQSCSASRSPLPPWRRASLKSTGKRGGDGVITTSGSMDRSL